MIQTTGSENRYPGDVEEPGGKNADNNRSRTTDPQGDPGCRGQVEVEFAERLLHVNQHDDANVEEGGDGAEQNGDDGENDVA